MTARTILVYTPDAQEAARYAKRIRPPRRGFAIHVAATAEEAAPVLADTEVLYAWGVPSELLARMPRLRWIQSMGAGVERFLSPELPPGVILTRAAGIFGPWMAEYTLGWCLWVTQRMEQLREQQRQRRWQYLEPGRLRGATLCVIGLGDIGRNIARLASAFGMTVLGVTRTRRAVREADRVYRPGQLSRALAGADYVVLTLPLTATTRGLIGARELAAMKRSAWLINIARGPIVDEAALLEALRAERIGGAILDVFDEEPLPPQHALWKCENVVITPHLSGPSTLDEVAPIFDGNLRRYLAGVRCATSSSTGAATDDLTSSR